MDCDCWACAPIIFVYSWLDFIVSPTFLSSTPNASASALLAPNACSADFLAESKDFLYLRVAATRAVVAIIANPIGFVSKPIVAAELLSSIDLPTNEAPEALFLIPPCFIKPIPASLASTP